MMLSPHSEMALLFICISRYLLSLSSTCLCFHFFSNIRFSSLLLRSIWCYLPIPRWHYYFSIYLLLLSLSSLSSLPLVYVYTSFQVFLAANSAITVVLPLFGSIVAQSISGRQVWVCVSVLLRVWCYSQQLHLIPLSLWFYRFHLNCCPVYLWSPSLSLRFPFCYEYDATRNNCI